MFHVPPITMLPPSASLARNHSKLMRLKRHCLPGGGWRMARSRRSGAAVESRERADGWVAKQMVARLHLLSNTKERTNMGGKRRREDARGGSNNDSDDRISEAEQRIDQAPVGDDDDSNREKGEGDDHQQDLDDATEEPSVEDDGPKRKKKVRKLKLDATEDFNEKLSKRGIVYLSRVPPRMTPSKVKTLLSDWGEITRIYLVEEDKTHRKKRRKAGGSSGKRYTEGWIEFASKKIAKLVGSSLNMTPISHQKGNMHHDDVWSVKYLKGFKWSHLTEKVAYERRVREQKLRVEMMEVKRENAAFVTQLEQGKKMDYIEERLRKKGNGGGASERKSRKIRQKKPFQGSGGSTKSVILGSLVS